MSLITRCPACETMFKVVPDQLRISDGWVRCGQCGEVFDAAQHLLTEPPDAEQEPGEHEPAAHGEPAGQAPQEATAESSETTAAGRQEAPVSIGSPLPAPAEPAAQGRGIGIEPRWSHAAISGHEPPLEPSLEGSATPQDPGQASASGQVQPVQAERDAPAVSFMRDGSSDSAWRRPLVRIGLLLLALLLLATLAVQVLVQERDRIVSLEPSTRPVLQFLCAWSRCELAPLRQIESIVIDSSSFSRIRGDTYQLGFSLKNTAAVDLAMPAMELSLTDSQDQALIRRVFLPADFGAASGVLSAASDWSGSLSLSVKAMANTERIAGYRLLAFYP